MSDAAPELLTAALIAKLEASLTPYQVARLRSDSRRHDSQRDLMWGACVMKRAQFTNAEIETVLRNKFANYYRDIDDREYERAIENADPNYVRTAPRWPEKNKRMAAEVLDSIQGSVDALRASSPIKTPELLASGEVIDRLFESGELICLGRTKALALTKPRTDFRGSEEDYQFIVPNPMSALTGKTTDGRTSTRCLTNTGPLRYQVIEFDSGTQDEQAKLLLHLGNFNFLLRMVVFSGGKSLHGWFDVRDLTTDMISSLRWYAAELGADRAMFTACQFARMPNGTRDNGEDQPVLFLS